MNLPRHQFWLILGALFGCLAVALGAFGAHGLEQVLRADSPGSAAAAQVARQLANWDTAARYQMYHALALLAVGLLAERRCGLAIHLAGTCLTLGTLLFSGCLYVLVLTGLSQLGRVVPIGGILLIVGWLCLLVAVCRFKPSCQEN